MTPTRRWKDLTSDQKKRRMAWVRGAWPVTLGGDDAAPPVDLEARRRAGEIRQRVRARRVREGRV